MSELNLAECLGQHPVIETVASGAGTNFPANGTVSLDMLTSNTIHAILNLLTGRWIDPNGKLLQKLIREGYKYADKLSDYLEDIETMYIGEFALDPLADFYYPALIPPLSILASRSDIRKKFPISVESAVVRLFTLEKKINDPPIQSNYSSDNLSALIGITWERGETKAWRNNVLMKFLHHPNLAPSEHRPVTSTSEQKVIRYAEKLARIFGLDKQNAEVYSTLSREIRALAKKLNDYHFEYISLKKTEKRLERDVESLETELEDLDDCANKDTVVDLIHEIVPLLISEKGKGYSDLSEESDLDETFVVRERKAVPYKQRRKVRPKKGTQRDKVKIKKGSSLGW
ncbi:1818_t:CDS:2 [Diversispora eburnea]|uniref:1818_t:CDS:1 n=1 Tax=Diversispora eburnea TaxID=1213867 RepID=A0A9N8ZHF9_9GLOM|nr:1818_t:CDS:2 [Diversispora eburnea]